MQIIKYLTEEEAQLIITEKTGQGLTLIAISNITEGNFLGFAENPQEIPSVYQNTAIEDRVSVVEETQTKVVDALVIITGAAL